MLTPTKTILIIGGTGAQGAAVVKALATSQSYHIKILTRSIDSDAARSLAALPNVSLIPSPTGYTETSLHSAFDNIDACFINTNGFALGEKAELYWGIRIFDIAAQHQVKHFVWASLDSSYKISGYDPKFRTGHFDGKAKVADWISAQPIRDGGMRWSILTSCMYLETLSQLLAPFKEVVDGEEVLVFKAPVGSGKPPMIALEDIGGYAKWMFDHPEEASGINLRAATALVPWTDLAETLTAITGKTAVFQNVSLDEYFNLGIFNAEMKVGHSVGEDETLQTYRENFSGFWNTWKEDVLSEGRDFERLDQILPGRVRNLRDWMVATGYTGARGSVLKDYVDRTEK